MIVESSIQSGNVCEGLTFDLEKAHHHIRHLDAGIVQIVLNLDLMTKKTKTTDEGITQSRVAQVAYMRSLIGVDVRMLYDNFTVEVRVPHAAIEFLSDALGQTARQRAAVEKEIKIAAARDVDFPNSRNVQCSIG